MEFVSICWDCLIVGGGPAGLTVGLHLARAGFKTLLLEKDALGGQARFIERVENYPGFPQGISGKALMRRFVNQAKRWRLKTLKTEVVSLKTKNGYFCCATGLGLFKAKTVILASGTVFKNLEIKGEEKFLGQGIYHAAFDEAQRFQGKTLAVVGGGDTAIHQALLLARYAKKIYLIYRGKSFKASRHLLKKLRFRKTIKILLQTIVERAEGKNSLESIKIRNLKSNYESCPDISALFVLIGKKPDFKLVGRKPHPKGLFLAGDIHEGDYRQIAIAAGDGIRAAMECERYLRKSSEFSCQSSV